MKSGDVSTTADVRTSVHNVRSLRRSPASVTFALHILRSGIQSPFAGLLARLLGLQKSKPCHVRLRARWIGFPDSLPLLFRFHSRS